MGVEYNSIKVLIKMDWNTLPPGFNHQFNMY